MNMCIYEEIYVILMYNIIKLLERVVIRIASRIGVITAIKWKMREVNNPWSFFAIYIQICVTQITYQPILNFFLGLRIFHGIKVELIVDGEKMYFIQV